MFKYFLEGCEFSCEDGSCISSLDMCDGFYWDCENHEDEFNCSGIKYIP